MEISAIRRDAAAAAAGQWVNDIPGMGDLRLRVRGLSSPVVTALRDRKERKVPKNKRQRDGRLTPAASIEVISEVFHEVVLLDWDGLTDQGKVVPYDRELAKKWLSDPDFAQFTDAVAWAAGVVDRGTQDEAEDVGNDAPNTSPGNSDMVETQAD